MSQEFQNDIVDIIVDLLKTNLGDVGGGFFKQFYNGDPDLIALSDMPCVTVKLENTDTESITTGQDIEHHTVVIKLVASKRSEFNKAPDEVTIERTLRQYAAGRDVTTNQIADNTVVGILRKYYTMNNKTHGQIVFSTQYPEEAARGFGEEGLTAEAHIRMQIDVLATVVRS